MSIENEKGIPAEAMDWQAPEEKPRMENDIKTNDQEKDPETIEIKNTENLPEISEQNFSPNPKNPIEKVTVGLYQNLGHFENPTRIILTLKDGSTSEMAWEKAEPFLPPEFRQARELGERANELESKAMALQNAVASGTDVRERSGHIKDFLFKLTGNKRPALKYLEASFELTQKIGKVAQESFLELRRMANIHEKYDNQIAELTAQFDQLQQEFEEAMTNSFQTMPKVKQMYEEIFNPERKRSSLKNDNRPELPDAQ